MLRILINTVLSFFNFLVLIAYQPNESNIKTKNLENETENHKLDTDASWEATLA